MMEQPLITCEQVDLQELDLRYLGGRLSEAEAAAFEAHYFGCDRCWGLVKGGAGVRAARPGGASVQTPRSRAWWKPLALAAGLGIVVLGTWRVVGPRQATDPDAIRGRRDSIAVQSEFSAGLWRAAWALVPDAAAYRVRVFTAEGRLLLVREVTDTVVALSADSLSALGPGAALYLDVQAVDLLRRPVASSPLLPLRSPGPSR